MQTPLNPQPEFFLFNEKGLPPAVFHYLLRMLVRHWIRLQSGFPTEDVFLVSSFEFFLPVEGR